MLLRFISASPIKVSRLFTARFPAFCNLRCSSSKKQELDDLNKPLSYINSQANSWQAKHSRIGTNSTDDDLWYEPFVVFGSIAVFMIYFCILREESDIDQQFDRSLYSRIDGLEESQLQASLKYYEENGLNTMGIKQRLKEIEDTKQLTLLNKEVSM